MKQAVLALGLALCLEAVAADRLPGHAADIAALTVSGLSSGGYMAIQVQVAHSSRVKGLEGMTWPA